MVAVAKLFMRRPLVIYDFATAPFWISLYMRKVFFISVDRAQEWLRIRCIQSRGCIVHRSTQIVQGVVLRGQKSITFTRQLLSRSSKQQEYYQIQ
jgi:hypothetical protein